MVGFYNGASPLSRHLVSLRANPIRANQNTKRPCGRFRKSAIVNASNSPFWLSRFSNACPTRPQSEMHPVSLRANPIRANQNTKRPCGCFRVLVNVLGATRQFIAARFARTDGAFARLGPSRAFGHARGRAYNGCSCESFFSCAAWRYSGSRAAARMSRRRANKPPCRPRHCIRQPLHRRRQRRPRRKSIIPTPTRPARPHARRFVRSRQRAAPTR